MANLIFGGRCVFIGSVKARMNLLWLCRAATLPPLVARGGEVPEDQGELIAKRMGWREEIEGVAGMFNKK